MDEGDVVVVEVAGGDGADEDAVAARLKMMTGRQQLEGPSGVGLGRGSSPCA